MSKVVVMKDQDIVFKEQEVTIVHLYTSNRTNFVEAQCIVLDIHKNYDTVLDIDVIKEANLITVKCTNKDLEKSKIVSCLRGFGEVIVDKGVACIINKEYLFDAVRGGIENKNVKDIFIS